MYAGSSSKKTGPSHGLVKCTCEYDDSLFVLRAVRLMESKNVETGQPASV